MKERLYLRPWGGDKDVIGKRLRLSLSALFASDRLLFCGSLAIEMTLLSVGVAMLYVPEWLVLRKYRQVQADKADKQGPGEYRLHQFVH